jgi:hypothetical protein
MDTSSTGQTSKTAQSETTQQSIADNLLTSIQPFRWSEDEQTTLLTQYNQESLLTAKEQSKQFDAIIHKWIREIDGEKNIFLQYIYIWTTRLYYRHPISAHITHLRMRRNTYSTSSLAYTLLIIANVLKLMALLGSVLFFFARHAPSLLPAIMRPSAEVEDLAWYSYIYKYSLGLIVGAATSAAQTTVDIGYSLAIASLIWVLSSYVSTALYDYSNVLQKRYILQRLELQFLEEFKQTIRNQLLFYLKPILFNAYRTFLALPISERAQLLGAYTRQDKGLETIHLLLLNECEELAFSPYIEMACTKQINDSLMKEMVQLGTTEYIDCYIKFKNSLDSAGITQAEQLGGILQKTAYTSFDVAKKLATTGVAATAKLL